MRSPLLFLGLVLSLGLAGCSTPPEARLERPALRVVSLDAGDGKLALRYINPNNVPLVVNNSTHVLSLDGQHIGRIKEKEPIGMPPIGEIVHTVALPPEIAKGARDYLAAHPGRVRATVESKLEVLLYDDETVTLKSSGGGTVGEP